MEIGKVYEGRCVGINERIESNWSHKFGVSAPINNIVLKSRIDFAITDEKPVTMLSVEVDGKFEIGDIFNIKIDRDNLSK